MSFTARRCRAGLSILFVAAAAAVAAEARADETIGVASLVRNNVSGVLPSRSFQINVGENVVRDEIVKTSQDSVAKLVFTDSTNLSVGPNSTVKLDKFVSAGPASYGKATINVVKGAFRFTTGHSDKRAYEINTGVATMGVRGTTFEGQSEPRQTVLNVLDGHVHVRTKDGQSCDLGPGQSAVITTSTCTPAVGFNSGSQIFAGQCASSPSLCETEEFAQLQQPGNEQGFLGGENPAMLLLPAAAIGGGIGAGVAASQSHQVNGPFFTPPQPAFFTPPQPVSR